MKKRSKILLSAVLTIALCLSLIAGSTFALFTSESKVNIAVTSGKVKVTAEITDPYVYSTEALDVAPTATESYYTENSAVVSDTIEDGNYAGTYYYKSQAVTKITTGDNAGDFTGNFANLGTASYDASEQELTLDRVTPGDRVKFTVAIGNESNVAIQYRVVVNVRSGLKLYNALTVKIDGVKLNGVNKTGTWTALAPTADIADIPVEVFMPLFRIDGNDNDYQNLSTKIEIAVEAVQGNAKTTNDVLSTTVEATKTVAAEAITADNTVAEGDGITISDANNLLTVTLPESTKLTDSNTEIMVKAEPQDTVSTINILTDNANKASMSFDVSVLFVTTTVEDDVETVTTSDAVAANNTEEITVTMFVGTGLTGVQLYHNSDPVESSKFSYDAATGYITFKTTGFSEYTVVYNADYSYETFDEDGKSTGIVVLEATELDGVYTLKDEDNNETYVTVTEDEGGNSSAEAIYPSDMTALGTATVSEILDGAKTAFQREGVLVADGNGVKYVYMTDGDVFLYSVKDYVGTIFTVPEFVNKMDSYCFYGNNIIETVVFTSQIESSYKSFDSNTSITKVECGNMTYIPNRFLYRSAVSSIDFGNVTEIKAYGLQEAYGLETLVIPEAITSIGARALYGAKNLKVLEIKGNPVIKYQAGRGLASLEKVYLRGDDVAFDTTKPANETNGNTHTFSSSEQYANLVSSFKIYVANETVKERIIASGQMDAQYHSNGKDPIELYVLDSISIVPNNDKTEAIVTMVDENGVVTKEQIRYLTVKNVGAQTSNTTFDVYCGEELVRTNVTLSNVFNTNSANTDLLIGKNVIEFPAGDFYFQGDSYVESSALFIIGAKDENGNPLTRFYANGSGSVSYKGLQLQNREKDLQLRTFYFENVVFDGTSQQNKWGHLITITCYDIDAIFNNVVFANMVQSDRTSVIGAWANDTLSDGSYPTYTDNKGVNVRFIDCKVENCNNKPMIQFQGFTQEVINANTDCYSYINIKFDNNSATACGLNSNSAYTTQSGNNNYNYIVANEDGHYLWTVNGKEVVSVSGTTVIAFAE